MTFKKTRRSMTALAVLTCTTLTLGGGFVAHSLHGIEATSDATHAQAGSGRSVSFPLRFDPNVGQADPRARFTARGAGYAAFLTAGGVVLSLAPAERGATPSVLTIGFRGGAANPLLSGSEEAPGQDNYVSGRDVRTWRRSVKGFGRVTYHDVYPGVDVVFYGRGDRLEYDLVLHPGADPGRIRLAIGGPHVHPRLDGAGRLLSPLPGGVVSQEPPLATQRTARGALRTVPSSFVLQGNGTVGLHVGRYDKRRTLVVDPIMNLAYGSFLGGSRDSSAHAVAVDSTGAVYVTGFTSSLDFPTTSGAYAAALNAPTRTVAFVSKLSPDGSSLVYSTYLAGSGGDAGESIAVDKMGAAYVTGSTFSPNFPTTTGAFAPSLGTDFGVHYHAFVTKLSPDGANLVYSTYLGGSDAATTTGGNDSGQGIAVDDAGVAYVAGRTSAADFQHRSYDGFRGQADA